MTTSITALGRRLDPSAPSNRFALFAPAVVFVVATLVLALTDPALGFVAAAGQGVRFAVGTFLAWAVARELHPDEPLAARNAVLAYLPAMLLGPPALAAVAAVLLAARVTLRSTGATPTVVDLVVLAVLAGVAATSAPGFVTGLALAWAVLEDARLPEPAPQLRAQLVGVGIAAVALTVSVLAGSFLTDWRTPRLPELVWVAVVVLAVVVRPQPTEVASPTDRRGPMSLRRLVRGRLVVAVTLAVALLWAGADAIPALAPAAAAIIGVGLVAPRWLGARDIGTPVDPPSGAHP